MAQIKFSKKEVAAKFEIVSEVDVKINTVGYDGMLSNAPLKTVEGMLARKSKLVKVFVKEPAPEKTVPPAAKK